MKVYWWNGGLHCEPENPVESEAMLILLSNLTYSSRSSTDEDGRGGNDKSANGGSCSAGEAGAAFFGDSE